LFFVSGSLLYSKRNMAEIVEATEKLSIDGVTLFIGSRVSGFPVNTPPPLAAGEAQGSDAAEAAAQKRRDKKKRAKANKKKVPLASSLAPRVCTPLNPVLQSLLSTRAKVVLRKKTAATKTRLRARPRL
jgi:hypothetical protein